MTLPPAAAVWLSGVVFCVYTLAGYPLLLALMARFRPRAVRKAPLTTTVSIVLPVHNGERWIGAKLESILALRYPPELIEILLADDDSTDETRRVAETYTDRA